MTLLDATGKSVVSAAGYYIADLLGGDFYYSTGGGYYLN
jgi:hypothetical protein